MTVQARQAERVIWCMRLPEGLEGSLGRERAGHRRRHERLPTL